jgi:hypothetical protein
MTALEGLARRLQPDPVACADNQDMHFLATDLFAIGDCAFCAHPNSLRPAAPRSRITLQAMEVVGGDDNHVSRAHLGRLTTHAT